MKNVSVFIVAYLLFLSILSGQDNEIIVYGIIDASPPFMFVNDQGEADGFAVDLYTRMMGDLEMPYEIRIEKINILYKDLLNGEIDLFTGMLYTKEDEKVFYFPNTSFRTSWGELFVGAHVLYSDIHDLEGETIGIVSEDLNGKNFILFMEQFDVKYYIREFITFDELFNAVRNGEVFGGITNSQYQQKTVDESIQPTATTFYPTSSYAVTGLDKGNIEALERLSQYLSELKSDPKSYYYELEQKWYNPKQNFLNSKTGRIIIIFFLTLSGIILILLWNNRYLKKEVARKVDQMNSQRVEKEKMALKNNFLASISHELRAPMSNISSLIFLLSQSNLDKNQRDKIEKINKASHHMLNVINRILDYNRLEKGQFHLKRQPFSLKGEIDDIISHFHEDVKNKGLYLESHLDENIPEILWGDSFRFSQILINLVDNAIKFSTRGTITLAVYVEELSKKSCRLCITVKDQGIGIDREQQESLFLPHSRNKNNLTQAAGESGLGLAITYHLVNLIKGSISVTSQKGCGSEFVLSLPFDIAGKKEKKKVKQPEEFDSYKGARVLYVEDNKINREIGLELFKLAEIDVTPAENGMEALEKLKESAFDLVLMDIQMPLMDGLTTARKIREQEHISKTPRLPIVALTAHFLEEDIDMAYQSGMDGHISKPISIGKLNREFEKWLSPYRSHRITEKKVLHHENISLPGIDMDDMAERFNGDYDLIQDSLTHFITDYSLMAGLLLSLGNQHKEEELKKELHTLKGVLGSLGMGDLYERAENLEEVLKEDKDYTEDLKSFSFKLEDLITSLEGRL